MEGKSSAVISYNWANYLMRMSVCGY